MCQKIEDSAKGFGADMLITACPLCKYNLNKNASSELPVYYFTELLAEALGVKRGGGKMRNQHSAAEKIKRDLRNQSAEMYEMWKMFCYLPIFNEMDIKPHQFCILCCK